ncbi:hypothetical protein ACHAXT_006280 [Thalassiosira profunda]
MRNGCHHVFASVSSSTGSDLLLRDDDAPSGITTLTLNHPEKLNVLSWDMLEMLQTQVDDIAADSAIRVLVIGAAGRAFSAGHDMKEIHPHSSVDDTKALFEKCSRFMTSLNKLPQPVIAKVQGVATAAGCQLVASCDLAVGSSFARFGVSGIKVGLFCSTPAVALSRAVQSKQAMRMLLTGELISADEALAYGLLNEVVAPEELETETMDLARKIAINSNQAIRLGKEMFYEQLRYDNLEEAYDFATERLVRNVQYPETKEAIDQFVNKKRR